MEEVKTGRSSLIEWTPIYSMWLRQVIRFFSHTSRVVTTFVQPFLFLGLMAIPMSRLFAGPSAGVNQMYQEMFQGLEFFAFLVPGMIGIGLLFSGTMGGLSVLWDKDFGFLKEVMVAPVSRLSLMIGRSLGAMTTALLQALVTLGVALIFGVSFGFQLSSVGGFFMALVFMVLTFATFVGFGLILGGIFEDTEGFMGLVNLIQMPIFFLSGAMIPIRQLEGVPILYQIQFVNPLTYGIDGMRACLTGAPSFIPLWLDLAVIFSFAVVMLILGARAFDRMEVG